MQYINAERGSAASGIHTLLMQYFDLGILQVVYQPLCKPTYAFSINPLLFTRDVSCRTHSAHGYGSADPIRQAGSRCMPLDPKHPACQSCDRKCSALEAEAAAISFPCSSSAVADVVLGSRNRLTAGVVREGGR